MRRGNLFSHSPSFLSVSSFQRINDFPIKFPIIIAVLVAVLLIERGMHVTRHMGQSKYRTQIQ